ncbi:MAG: hypothetical protein ACKVN9_01605 [Methylophilaceae bacterium]
MIVLKHKDTGFFIGTLSEEQLQFLVDQLEEEASEDQDYWINRAQLEIFKEQGADAGLVLLLEKAMGSGDEMEIVWSRD